VEKPANYQTNGYYIGTFNYNSTANYILAVLAERNLNHTR